MLDQLLTIALCIVLPAISMTVIGVIGTQARIEMVEQINRLKAHGTYAKWADQNKTIIFLERIGLTGLLLSLVGFIVLSPLNPELARFAFVTFICFAILLLGVFFLFHNRIMQSQSLLAPPLETRAGETIQSKIKNASIIFVAVAILVYVSSKLEKGKHKNTLPK